MKTLNDILGYKNMHIYQDDDYFCFSLDSVYLANYVNIRFSDKKICDLGTGNGVIPIILSRRTKADLYCAEIQKKLFDLANESFTYNNLSDRIKSFNCDISDRTIFDFNEFFDLVVSNPPYFKLNEKSYLNISEEKQIARHEIKMDLDKLFSVSSRILKSGGNICVVHRPERLLDIIDTMRKYSIEPKRIKYVFQNVNSKSKLLIVEGQKNGCSGLLVDSPLIMYNIDGSMTEEYKNMTEEVRK